MKILHIVHEFAPFKKNAGGTGRYVYGLAREQARQGHTVSVLTQHRNTYTDHLALDTYTVDEKITVYKINISNFMHPQELYRRTDTIPIYDNILSQAGFDLVHIHHFIGLSTSIAECCEKNGIPFGITFHDFWPFCIRYHMIDYGRQNHDCARLRYTQKDCIQCLHQCHFHQEKMNKKGETILAKYIKTKNKYFTDLINKAAFVTGPSKFIKKIYDKTYNLPADKFRVETLGIELQGKLKPKKSLPWIQFGYIGAIEARKGVDILLRVFKELPYPLHIWGYDPQEPAFEEYAKTQPNLHFHGVYDSTKDLAKIFSKIHICLVPSLSESYGITARESLAYRVPVIASNWGGMPEAVLHKRNGIHFKVGDEKSLKKAVRYAAEHPEEIKVMEKYTLQKLVHMKEHTQRMIALYKSILP